MCSSSLCFYLLPVTHLLSVSGFFLSVCVYPLHSPPFRRSCLLHSFLPVFSSVCFVCLSRPSPASRLLSRAFHRFLYPTVTPVILSIPPLRRSPPPHLLHARPFSKLSALSLKGSLLRVFLYLPQIQINEMTSSLLRHHEEVVNPTPMPSLLPLLLLLAFFSLRR